MQHHCTQNRYTLHSVLARQGACDYTETKKFRNKFGGYEACNNKEVHRSPVSSCRIHRISVCEFLSHSSVYLPGADIHKYSQMSRETEAGREKGFQQCEKEKTESLMRPDLRVYVPGRKSVFGLQT